MMHAYQHRIVEALCLAALSACTNVRPALPNNTIVIDHVTILDGRGGDAVPDARVVVRGDRIISISRSSQPLPPQQRVIDGTGKFLLPGFIDMHAHLLIPRCSSDDGPPQFDWALSARSLARQLDFGITTVRSPATPTKIGLRMRDELNRGRVRGPHAEEHRSGRHQADGQTCAPFPLRSHPER